MKFSPEPALCLSTTLFRFIYNPVYGWAVYSMLGLFLHEQDFLFQVVLILLFECSWYLKLLDHSLLLDVFQMLFLFNFVFSCVQYVLF